MAPLLNELFTKIELFYIKIGAINNYFTLIKKQNGNKLFIPKKFEKNLYEICMCFNINYYNKDRFEFY